MQDDFQVCRTILTLTVRDRSVSRHMNSNVVQISPVEMCVWTDCIVDAIRHQRHIDKDGQSQGSVFRRFGTVPHPSRDSSDVSSKGPLTKVSFHKGFKFRIIQKIRQQSPESKTISTVSESRRVSKRFRRTVQNTDLYSTESSSCHQCIVTVSRVEHTF
jgi:hypothetical protein